MLTGDYAHTLDRVRFRTQNNSITLPREYEAVRMVNIDNIPAPIVSTTYDFISSGPGEWSWDQCDKLVYQGTFPTFFDPPTDEDYPCRLWAASTHADDATITLQYQARSPNGAEILDPASGSPLLPLSVNHWTGGVEGTLTGSLAGYGDYEVHKLLTLRLPTGRKGYVSLFAYHVSDGKMWFLGKYHPSETMPGYRRYRLPVSDKDNGRYVNCLCKKQFIPAMLDTDILLIQDLDAIKNMVQAIEAENVKDINGSMAYKTMAVERLKSRQSDETRGQKFQFAAVDTMASSGLSLL
jgi:hypothetical protein